MKLSQQGVDLIKSFEGCRLKAYLCDAGVQTIGWGHTGPEVVKGLVWTQQQADDAFDKDTDRFEAGVWSELKGNELLALSMTAGKFDALVSLAFNIGLGPKGFGGSTLLRLLLEGRHFDAAEQFTRWNKAGGKFNPGLLARRTKEMRIFLVGH